MKKTKIVFVLLVIAALLVSLAACGGNVYEDPFPLPETVEPEPEPEVEPEPDEPGIIDPIAPLPDSHTADIVVNGTPLIDADGDPVSALMVGEDELFPTHVPILPVMEALGITPVLDGGDDGAFLADGLIGRISFTLGSNTYYLDGEAITLFDAPVEHGGEIFVPVLFFRDLFGAGNAFSSHGQIFIDTEGDDMH